VILYRIQKEKHTHLIPSAARSYAVKELEERIIDFINVLPDKKQVLDDFCALKSRCLHPVQLVIGGRRVNNENEYYN
jgi:hypothetical protein